MSIFSYGKYKEKLKVEFDKKQNHQVYIRGTQGLLSDLHSSQT